MMKLELVAILCLAAGTGLAQTTNATPDKPAADKLVVVTLDGEIRETPPEIDLGVSDLMPNLFWDRMRLIRTAAKDDKVKAIVLLIKQPKLDLAQSQQLAAELRRFTAAGKKLYVHADSLSAGTYLQALPADKIAMSPGAMLMLAGVRLQVFYYKDLMAKLGIEAEVVHVGKYKLAAEPYTRSTPSEAMVEQLTELANEIYDQIAGQICLARKISPDRIDSIIDEGPFMAEQALEAKLIDRVCHRDKFLTEIKEATGGKLVYGYGRTKTLKIQPGMAGFFQLFRILGAGRRAVGGDKIAIVVVNGFIVEGASKEFWSSAGTAGSETLRKAFKKINQDNQIKAVVVRVNSPGGSASASEIIWNAISTTAARKPVVVSMGGSAASGGYYIACAGHYIFASPATITGSIGVVAGKPVLDELLKKIGVAAFAVSKGKNAAMLDPFTRLTEHQRKTLQRLLERVYNRFIERVARGRAGKIDDVSKLATGKVFTGRQAVKLGLADRIGTLADAVEWAAKKAGIDSYNVILMPQPKTLPEIILEGFGYDLDPEAMQTVSRILVRVLGNIDSSILQSATGSGMLDASMLRRIRNIVRVFGKGNPLMLAPYHIEIR